MESDYEGKFTKKERDDWIKKYQTERPVTPSDIDQALKEFEESKKRGKQNVTD